MKSTIKSNLKKVGFYLVGFVFVVLFVSYLVDAYVDSKYDDVLERSLGEHYQLVDCRASEDVGVRICYAKPVGVGKDGYAVRLSKSKLLIKHDVSYEQFKKDRGDTK